MNNLSFQKLQGLLLIATIFVISVGFYLQYQVGLHPCSLCIMQRGCIIFFGVCCLAALFITSGSLQRRLVITEIFFIITGLFFATRQVWLQSLPINEAPACLPALDVLINYFPWHEVLLALIWGAGSCAEITWKFMGLSIAAWSVIYFLVMLFISSYMFIQFNQPLFTKSKQ